MARVLVIDDDPGALTTLTVMLRQAGYAVETAESGERGVEIALSGVFDAILSDMRLPGMSGLDVLRQLRERRIDTALLIMTGYGTVETAVEAMKLGAVDFVQKPVFRDELLMRLTAAIERRQLARQVRVLERRLDVADPLRALIGDSAPMARVRELVRRVAAAPGTVLITGETGTGKELVARAIHAESGRASGPFVTFSCAPVSEVHLELELFGHVKGAFPGATVARRGLLEHADGGTLMLDEIGLLPMDLQARLARVLDSGDVRRVGGRDDCRVDVRVIAVTNTDLAAAVAGGTFRDDLLHRLRVHHVHLPPLRERPGDIERLVEHFLKVYSLDAPCEMSAGAWRAILSFEYPGNVRELGHVVQRAIAIAQDRTIDLADLPETVVAAAQQNVQTAEGGVAAARDRAERGEIVSALARHQGDLVAVAADLQISRTTLWRLMRKHGIQAPGE
jgi:two-component system response regulator HydG